MERMLKAANVINNPDSYLHEIGDNEVLKWINNFVMHSCRTVRDMDIMRDTFRAGYCYFFAHMLQDAFKRGTVCLAAPFSHWVWEDANGNLYDVEGLYQGEAMYFIPEDEYTLSDIGSFLHTNDEAYIMKSEEEIIELKDKCKQMMLDYCARHGIKYNDYADYLLYGVDVYSLN